MLFMQMGLIVVQLPMGALSDGIDRRYVLIMVSLLAAAMALTTIGFQSHLTLVTMILIFAIWSGANETIYSVSSALANDRADPKHLVFLSSTLMIAWSTGAFVIPLITTLVLTFMPLETMMWFTVMMALPYAAFVVYRMSVRSAVVPENRDPFQTATAQVADGLAVWRVRNAMT